jgi:1-phosphofructokinase
VTRMIYTLALNPTIDRTFWVDRIDFEEANRVQKECRYPGGKGIDVSRVLTNLEVPNTALGFIGGFVGDELECRLTSEGVRTDLIHISGETRTNIIVHERDTGRHILLTARGPEISPHELGALLSKLEGLKDLSLLAIGGSLPPGVHPEAYHRIIRAMKKRNLVTLLDADGDALKVGVQGGPTYIKPNRHELSQLVGRELTGLEDIMDAAEDVRLQGVDTVLVSMGGDGIVLVGEDRRYLATPPKVDVVNTIGLGDSAVAGFVYGLATGLELKECLIYATAAGTATALKPGTARANKQDVLKMLPRIKFKDLSRSTG